MSRHFDHIRSDDPARSVSNDYSRGIGTAHGPPASITVFHDHGGTVAAMMAAMMSNNHHLAH